MLVSSLSRQSPPLASDHKFEDGFLSLWGGIRINKRQEVGMWNTDDADMLVLRRSLASTSKNEDRQSEADCNKARRNMDERSVRYQMCKSLKATEGIKSNARRTSASEKNTLESQPLHLLKDSSYDSIAAESTSMHATYSVGKSVCVCACVLSLNAQPRLLPSVNGINTA